MNEHLQQVMDELEKEPLKRVNEAMQALIKSDDECPMFDIHCHFFNFKSICDRVFQVRLPFTTRFFKRAEDFLHGLLWWTDADPLSYASYFVNIGKEQSEEEIAQKLFSYYPDKTIFTPLLMDTDPGVHNSHPKITYYEQINRMKQLMDNHPAKVLPFVALDPNNDNMETIFKEALLEHHFFGVKIYPALGYLPSHPRLMEVFKVCEKMKIPVTVHCSTALIRTNQFPVKKLTGQIVDFNTASPAPAKKWLCGKKAFEKFFNHPRNWIPVLQKYPELKLNLGHFGRKKDWVKQKKGKLENWCNYIISLMTNYENVYADFSCHIGRPEIYDPLLELLSKNQRILERTLYGSDYYMVVALGHMRSFISGFSSRMGDQIMQKLAYENPKRFLFD